MPAAHPVHLSSLHIHPVKSCAAIAVTTARMLPRGLENDRAFMIVRIGEDGRGLFVTQREHPRLATVRTALLEGGVLRLEAGDGSAHVELPLDPRVASEGRARLPVRVWSDTVEAALLGGDATAFFTHVLGFEAHLVVMPPDVRRPVDPTYAAAGDHVSFADGFPLLLASEDSLADLNARICEDGGDAVPMSRFRPNAVLSGAEPFQEERHARIRIGDVVFRAPKRCGRCQITTVDQATGHVPSKEPLRTLARYRREGSEVYFAQNLVPEGLDDASDVRLTVGDAIEFLD